MTDIDTHKILNYYKVHSDHVLRLMNGAEVRIEPTGSDRINPALWKGIHWKWFFEPKD